MWQNTLLLATKPDVSPEFNILGALPLRVKIPENSAAAWDQILSKA